MSFGGQKRRFCGKNNSFSNSKFQRQNFNEGPPEEVIVVGKYTHQCEGLLVVRASIQKVPYFNALIYLDNKRAIGKVDEIFGPINGFSFSVKLNDGFLAASLPLNQTLFIDPNKLLPLSRFLPQPPGSLKTQTNQRGNISKQGRGGQGFQKFSRFGSNRGGSQRGGRGGGGSFRGQNSRGRGSNFRGGRR